MENFRQKYKEVIMRKILYYKGFKYNRMAIRFNELKVVVIKENRIVFTSPHNINMKIIYVQKYANKNINDHYFLPIR